MDGWIPLWRKAFDNPLFDEPFNRFQAWCWMIKTARWRDGQTYFRHQVIDLKRGQFATTERQLARDWSWSRDRVSKFLADLEKAAMIRPEIRQGLLIVTLCNYDTYAVDACENGQASGHGSATDRPESRHSSAGEPPLVGHSSATTVESKEREEGKEGEEGKHTECAPAPPAMAGSSWERKLVAQWNKNDGTLKINFTSGEQLIRGFVARGASPQAVAEAISNAECTRGKKLWEILEPLCPAPPKLAPMDPMEEARRILMKRHKPGGSVP